jgi:hypothetical protein
VPAGLAVGGGEVLKHGAGYWEEIRESLEIEIYSFSYLLTTLSYLAVL